MDKIENLVSLALLLYLLPGFLGGVIYEAVAEARQRTTFERLLIALVLTLLATLLSHWIFATPLFPSIKISPKSSLDSVLAAFVGRNLAVASAISALIGLAAAWIQNKGWLYDLLRSLGITSRTGGIDVWHEVFSRNRQIWVQVRFKDGRLLIGWPEHYSEDGDQKELFVADATWLIPQRSGRPDQLMDVAGPGVYVVDWKAIEAIEILD